MADLAAAVITVSDSVSAGAAEDASGPVAVAALEQIGFDVRVSEIVPDGVESVSSALTRLAGTVSLIVTTGGTGLGPRDLTPEATLSVLDRQVPGISEAMRADTFGKVPFGMLSRGVSGLIGGCLVINLPGSPKAVAEGLAVVSDVLVHAVEISSDVFGRHD
ncbi:MAG: MogA/MoaB family molybdenum cofactor biosynthesis protein [Actinomycetota bacterium]